MSNLYREAERRDKVIEEAVDLTVHNNKVWFAEIVTGMLAIIIFWR